MKNKVSRRTVGREGDVVRILQVVLRATYAKVRQVPSDDTRCMTAGQNLAPVAQNGKLGRVNHVSRLQPMESRANARVSVAHHQVLDGALAGVGCVLEDETQEGHLRLQQRHTSYKAGEPAQTDSHPNALSRQPYR